MEYAISISLGLGASAIMFVLGFLIGKYATRLDWMEKDPEGFRTRGINKQDRKLMNVLDLDRQPAVYLPTLTPEERLKMDNKEMADFKAGFAPSAQEMEEQENYERN